MSDKPIWSHYNWLLSVCSLSLTTVDTVMKWERFPCLMCGVTMCVVVVMVTIYMVWHHVAFFCWCVKCNCTSTRSSTSVLVKNVTLYLIALNTYSSHASIMSDTLNWRVYTKRLVLCSLLALSLSSYMQ